MDMVDHLLFPSQGKTIYLGMDPDSNVATKWTDVKHPKMGLVLRVAKPKANTSLFKEILEDRLLTEHGSTEVSEDYSCFSSCFLQSCRFYIFVNIKSKLHKLNFMILYM